MTASVLDASAALAVIRGEAGAEIVLQSTATGAQIATVNASECLAKLIGRGTPPAQAWIALSALRLEFVPFDLVLARAAAELIPVTRAFGLSFADRACLALAQSRGLPVLTADHAWQRLHLGVEIRLIR